MTPNNSTPVQNAADDTLHAPARIFPYTPDSCELTVACADDEFSASRLARAIEDCDAHLLNLNVTADRTDGDLTVLLRAGLRNPDSAIRALERYGYRVVAVHSAPVPQSDSLGERAAELLARINV